MMDVITVEYSVKLKEEAEGFMITLFRNPKQASEVQPVMVEAAMNIIGGQSFYQPSFRSENCELLQPQFVNAEGRHERPPEGYEE